MRKFTEVPDRAFIKVIPSDPICFTKEEVKRMINQTNVLLKKIKRDSDELKRLTTILAKCKFYQK